MNRCRLVLTALLTWAPASALAQQGQGQPMLPKQNMVLPWVVGIGILICTVIVAFKHPGRSHLD